MMVVWVALLLSFIVVLLLLPKDSGAGGDGDFDFDLPRLQRVLTISMVLSLLQWGVAIYAAGGLMQFLLSHWYTRGEELAEQYGHWFSLWLQLTLANQIFFTGVAAFYASLQLRQRRYRWRFFSLVLLFFVVEMVMEGNRIFIAVFLLSVISSCWLFGRKKVIAGILLVAPLIAFAFVAWASLRSSLTNIEENFAGYLTTDIGNRTETTLIDAFDGTGSMLLLHVVNDFGREHPYLYGLSYSRALTFVIPRSVYPQRPESFSVMLADTYEPGQGTSLSSTVLGEMYANFGPFSMLLLPLFTAALISLHNRLIARRERYVLLASVSFVLMIWHVRIAFAETFVSFLLCGVAIWGLGLESGLCSRVQTHASHRQ
jgi:oligosaccharide repeat unit polymerase